MSPPDAAPADLRQLRALALKISRGQSSVTLGPKAGRALDDILALQWGPELLSITALAGRLQVDPSTITRLARSLGYAGFGALQRVLLTDARPHADFYSRQARPALRAAGCPVFDQAAGLCRENQANIEQFIQTFDSTSFEAVVSLLTNAPRVSVHGIRQFHSLASFLVYGLRMIRSDVNLVGASGLGAAEDIAAMEPGDVLLSTSCAPYSGEVVDVLQAASEYGLQTIAFTDVTSSPLVRYCDQSILVPHITSFLSNSMTAFTAAAECLINACASAQPTSAEESLARRDSLIRRLSIEVEK